MYKNCLKLLGLLLGLLGSLAGYGGWLFWGPGGFYQAGPHDRDQIFIIDRQTGHREIGQHLIQQGMLTNLWSFYAGLVVTGHYGHLQKGEFHIPAHASPQDIIQKLAKGQVILHTITFPEGVSVCQIVQQIESIPQLKGPLESLPPEGSLFPDTYTYTYGQTRQSLIHRMGKKMSHTLKTLRLTYGIPPSLKSSQEILILASIVEKETGIQSERARVAQVFLNRLAKGMKLQSDPTVIYGITLGKPLARPLTRQDLQTPTPFNTYTLSGLPSSPISCPGYASLHAVFQPDRDSKDLFFVANGSGGHTFSETYQAHQKHVQAWRHQEKMGKMRGM